LLIEMQNIFAAKHKVPIPALCHTSYTITPPLFEKLKESCPLDDLKATDARLRRHKLH